MGLSGSITLDGEEVLVPREFFKVAIKATFGENIQSNLTTEEFTFILDGYLKIKDHIAKGRSGGIGIFEGVPISISGSNGNNNVSVFKGILDLQNKATINDYKKEIKCTIRQDENLNQLSDLIEPLDYGYLESIGVISSSDYINVDYVVIKIDNRLETATTIITVFLLTKQLVDTIKEIAITIANISGIAGAVPGGPIGAIIFAIASAIIQIIYAITLLALIIDFGKDLLNIIIPPIRTHKAILLKTLIEKACEHIGFSFNTSIEDLDNLVYLPSNLNTDEFGVKNVLKKAGSISKGIPNITDSGYTCTELFQIARDKFNARFAIVNGVVQFHSENSSYWLSQSTWIKKDAVQDLSSSTYRYNTDEVKGSILISYQTDTTEEYTLQNYQGTSFQVLTDAKNVSVETNKTIKGLDRVSIPLALGSRKSKLSPFEDSLIPLANLFDKVSSIFRGRANLAKKIKTKVGVLEVSNNNHATPKLLFMKGGRIPSNHRELLSAKSDWDKYQNEKSFVQNNYSRQRKYIEKETIPFGLDDFVSLQNNSYFKDKDGIIGKVVDIEWNMLKDTAIIDYWTQETYTNNLQETFIEPS